MANTQSAKKYLRQNTKRRKINDAKRRTLKETIKAALTAIQAKDGNVSETVQLAQKAIGKAAQTRVIHPNKAARLTSRLNKKQNAGKA